MIALFAIIWKFATDDGRSSVWIVRLTLLAAEPHWSRVESQRQPVGDDLDRLLIGVADAARGGDLQVVGVAVAERLPVVLPKEYVQVIPPVQAAPGPATRLPETRVDSPFGDVVQEVEVVVEELRGVAVDAGLGRLVGASRSRRRGRSTAPRSSRGRSARPRGSRSAAIMKTTSSIVWPGLVPEGPQQPSHDGGVSRRVALLE